MGKKTGEKEDKIRNLSAYRKRRNAIQQSEQRRVQEEQKRNKEMQDHSYRSRRVANETKSKIPHASKEFPPPKIQKKKVVKSRNKSIYKFTGWVVVLGLSIMVFLVAFMYRYSMISAMKYEINQKQRELKELQDNRSELKQEIERSKRSDLIEQFAREQLGMQYLTEEQKRYINVE